MSKIVTKEERERIQETYMEFRRLGLGMEAARKATAEKLGRGRTTVYDNTVGTTDFGHVIPPFEGGRVEVEWPKTYIISGWELRVGINDKFVETLKQMADYYDAQLLLTPCQESDLAYLPEDIKNTFTIIKDNFKLNNNLQFKYVETNALIQSPISGHVGAYPDYTTILPGLVRELRTEPSQHYVKQLISTGSLGYLNAKFNDYDEENKDFVKKWRTLYTRKHGKATAIADNYIVPSALIVDVIDSKTFLTRFITSDKRGTVYDLNLKFTPDGCEESKPLALVVGDTHAYSADENAVSATLDMIHFFEPKEVVLNDFFDGASVNHHEFNSAAKFHSAPSIREETDITIKMLKRFSDASNKVTYLNSNHDNFILSYLDAPQTIWRLNRNYDVACSLQMYRMNEKKHPITKLLEFDSFDNVKFVSERENYYIGKTLIKHGHEGLSGARVGFLTAAKIYNNYVAGHSHNPTVFRNAVCVGLTASLDQEYTMGNNGWLHANALIQPDSSTQLLPIINGNWIRTAID